MQSNFLKHILFASEAQQELGPMEAAVLFARAFTSTASLL